MKSHYLNFVLELIVEGIIMFFVMYAMVDVARHVYLNANTLYMAVMMVAPMGLVMMLFMGSMFHNKTLNLMLMLLLGLLFVGSFYAVRQQTAIGNEQFLRSMIPHHSGALLMCRKATLTDPEIASLCSRIIDSQQREIDQMEAILKKY